MSTWEETPGQTQNLMQGPYSSSILGTPWDPPEEDGTCGWGEGLLLCPAKLAATVTRTG